MHPTYSGILGQFLKLQAAHSLKQRLIAAAFKLFFILQVFEGNTDGNTTVSHWLVQPVKARFCTVKPKTWNEQIALRLELYGKVALGKN